MRWLLVLFLMAFTPIHVKHDEPAKVDDEFRNVELNLQDQQFMVTNSTPVWSKMKDRQIMIYSSGTVNALIWKYNQDIYVVRGSCITVWR